MGDTPTARPSGWWLDAAGARYEGKRVQRVVIAQHSMSLGEERVYETLWRAREVDGVYTESRKSKMFSLGYDRIARLVRLNEKSVRILLPKLIAKKILEVVAAEDSATRTGRTYRIFSYEEILDRQRAASLSFIVKSGRAVEFVWPEGPTVGERPTAIGSSDVVSTRRAPDAMRPYTVGVSTSVGVVRPTDDGKSGSPAGRPVTMEIERPYPLDLAAKVRAVLGGVDDDALRALWTRCVQRAPDCTSEEVEYFLQLKAAQLLGRGKNVINPVGLMLWAVPKCFEGPNALHLAYRQEKQAEEELRRQAVEDYNRQIEEYRQLLRNPDTSAEDRAWYQKLLEKMT